MYDVIRLFLCVVFFYVHISVLLSVSVLHLCVFALSVFWRINVFIKQLQM